MIKSRKNILEFYIRKQEIYIYIIHILSKFQLNICFFFKKLQVFYDDMSNLRQLILHRLSLHVKIPNNTWT